MKVDGFAENFAKKDAKIEELEKKIDAQNQEYDDLVDEFHELEEKYEDEQNLATDQEHVIISQETQIKDLKAQAEGYESAATRTLKAEANLRNLEDKILNNSFFKEVQDMKSTITHDCPVCCLPL